MLGRMVALLIAGGLLLTLVVQASCAADIIINRDYQMASKNIIVRFILINITDYPMGNVYPPENAGEIQWVRLVYQFQNVGDVSQRGYVQPNVVGSDDKVYTYRDYTGQDVLPHTTTDPAFVEIPMPEGVGIRQVVFVEGFTEHVFEVPEMPVPTPTPVPSATTPATATPALPSTDITGCLPYIPFAMAGGIAAAGMVINRTGIRKR